MWAESGIVIIGGTKHSSLKTSIGQVESWINLAQDSEGWQTCENGNFTFGFHKLCTISWPALKKDSAPWSVWVSYCQVKLYEMRNVQAKGPIGCDLWVMTLCTPVQDSVLTKKRCLLIFKVTSNITNEAPISSETSVTTYRSKRCQFIRHPSNSNAAPCMYIYAEVTHNTKQHIIYLNINQLDALNFIISLFHASTCFEHMCSSLGGHMCSKHVEAWYKLIIKFSASSW